MIDMPLKGRVQEISLPQVLVHLNRHRMTGTLMLTTPVFVKKAFLVKGDAIFASSTYEDDRLGEMLIKAGKITMEQYDKSVELLKQTGKRQGAILVELGYLSPKDLFWGVKYQVREIIYSLLQLEEAEYEFIEDDIPSHEVITLKMSMGNLIYEGVKRIDNWTRIKKEMPSPESILALSHDPAALFQDIELTQQDRNMLSMVDGKKTIKELIDGSLVGSFEAMKILYVLWSIGVLEEKEKEPETAEMIQEAVLHEEEILKPLSEDDEIFRTRVDQIFENLDNLDPYQLLEVDKDTDEESLTKNYYKLSKEYHPDRYFAISDASVKDKLTAIFDAITHAYTVLRGTIQEKGAEQAVPVQAGIVEVSAHVDADEYYREGIENLKQGHFENAVSSLKKATEANPENAKYWSYLSLALSKLPAQLREAEGSLFEAIKIEPNNADHYVNLGLIYLKGGLKKRAYGQFEKALKLDPDNNKARKGLEMAK